MCMFKRSDQPELMDLGPAFYTAEEYDDCLHKLGIIGTVFGSDAATLKAFHALPVTPQSILDVGCGGGAFTVKLAQNFPQARVVGIDIVPEALVAAQTHQLSQEHKSAHEFKNLSFEHREYPQLAEPEKSFDVVTATLVFHHLNDDNLIEFLRAAGTIARKAIIINDLHRHPLAYAAFWLIAPLFKNRMIRNDGLLSIKRGFTRAELKKYLQAAGFAPGSYKIRWRWAFRWIVTVTCS